MSEDSNLPTPPPSPGDRPAQPDAGAPEGGLEGDSWLLDVGPEPGTEFGEHEAVPALPMDWDEKAQPAGWTHEPAASEVPPSVAQGVEVFEDHAQPLSDYEEFGDAGEASFIEPMPRSRPVIEAILPGSLAMLLSFSGIAVWSFLRTPRAFIENVELARSQHDINFVGNEDDVQLATPLPMDSVSSTGERVVGWMEVGQSPSELSEPDELGYDMHPADEEATLASVPTGGEASVIATFEPNGSASVETVPTATVLTATVPTATVPTATGAEPTTGEGEVVDGPAPELLVAGSMDSDSTDDGPAVTEAPVQQPVVVASAEPTSQPMTAAPDKETPGQGAPDMAAPGAVAPGAAAPAQATVDPIASELVASDPSAAEPAAVKPSATESVASEPAASEPAVLEPVAADPVATGPVTPESAVGEADRVASDAAPAAETAADPAQAGDEGAVRALEEIFGDIEGWSVVSVEFVGEPETALGEGEAFGDEARGDGLAGSTAGMGEDEPGPSQLEPSQPNNTQPNPSQPNPSQPGAILPNWLMALAAPSSPVSVDESADSPTVATLSLPEPEVQTIVERPAFDDAPGTVEPFDWTARTWSSESGMNEVAMSEPEPEAAYEPRVVEIEVMEPVAVMEPVVMDPEVDDLASMDEPTEVDPMVAAEAVDVAALGWPSEWPSPWEVDPASEAAEPSDAIDAEAGLELVDVEDLADAKEPSAAPDAAVQVVVAETARSEGLREPEGPFEPEGPTGFVAPAESEVASVEMRVEGPVEGPVEMPVNEPVVGASEDLPIVAAAEPESNDLESAEEPLDVVESLDLEGPLVASDPAPTAAEGALPSTMAAMEPAVEPSMEPAAEPAIGASETEVAMADSTPADPLGPVSAAPEGDMAGMAAIGWPSDWPLAWGEGPGLVAGEEASPIDAEGAEDLIEADLATAPADELESLVAANDDDAADDDVDDDSADDSADDIADDIADGDDPASDGAGDGDAAAGIDQAERMDFLACVVLLRQGLGIDLEHGTMTDAPSTAMTEEAFTGTADAAPLEEDVFAGAPLAGDEVTGQPIDEEAVVAAIDEESSLGAGVDGSGDLPEVSVEFEPEAMEQMDESAVEGMVADQGDVAEPAAAELQEAEREVVAAMVGPALPEFAPVLLPPSPDLVADLFDESSADPSGAEADPASPVVAASIPAGADPESVATEFESAGVSREVAQAEIEVEVVGSVAEEAPTRRRRRVLERIEDDRYWRFKSVPSRKFDSDHMIFTPNVGRVRVVLNGGEAFDGRLHSVGQGKIMLDTKMGRMAVDSRRAERVDRLTDDRSELRDPSSSTSTVGLKRVKVRTSGGTFYGHLVSRRGDRVTLLMDEGFRITLESNDVTEAADSRGGRLRRVGPR